MRVEIRSHNIDHPRAVCAHAARRLDTAVRRFQGRILTAQVHISDQNGSRGGVDKRCLIQLQGHALHLIVEGTGADTFSAVDDAFDRLGRSVRRALDKERAHTPEAAGRRMVQHLVS